MRRTSRFQEPIRGMIVLFIGLATFVSCHAGSRTTPTDPLFPYLFTTGPSVLTGEFPEDAVLLDFDDDSILDLVTANSRDGTLSVFRGIGDGTFDIPNSTTITIGAEPRALFTAKINGDRFPDLLVSLFSAQTVAILINDGAGGFLAPRGVEVGFNPSDVEAGDFDRDGTVDLVTANQGSGTISLALGNGNGGFGVANHFSVVGNPIALSVGDLDRDSFLDIAVASTDADTVSVLFGDGAGGFPREINFTEFVAPGAVFLREVDGDGATDLVVTSLADNTVTVLTNDFQGSATPSLTFQVGQAPGAIALAQLAGDDLPDLIVANRGDNTISILRGMKSGFSLTFEEPFAVPVGKSPVALTIGDLERDRDSDILVVARDASSISVLQSRFEEDEIRTEPSPTGEGPSSLAVGDFNGDGTLDAVTSDNTGGTLTIHQGNGDGTFNRVGSLSVGSRPRTVRAGDFDLDGLTDVVFVLSGSDENLLVILHGEADFQLDRRLEFPTNEEPRDLVVADLNRDLVIDVVVLSGRQPASVCAYLGDGAGGLLTPKVCSTVGLGPQSIDIGDLNRDLIPDLLIASTGDDRVCILFGLGDGTFEAGPVIQTEEGSAPRGIETGDFNGDTFLDVVVTLSMLGQVQILFGDGEGDFLRDEFDPTTILGIDLEIFGQPRSVRASDLDSDGILDLAVGLFGRSTVAILIGDGAGALVPSEGIDVGDGPSDIVFADFDRNGERDLATANSLDNTISFVLHRGRSR